MASNKETKMVFTEFCELMDGQKMARIIKDCWHYQDYSILPPLFHGTDASLLCMSKVERDQLNAACEVVINAVFGLFRENAIMGKMIRF